MQYKSQSAPLYKACFVCITEFTADLCCGNYGAGTFWGIYGMTEEACLMFGILALQC